MVVYDIAFKRETYFDGSFGVLTKVSKSGTNTIVVLITTFLSPLSWHHLIISQFLVISQQLGNMAIKRFPYSPLR